MVIQNAALHHTGQMLPAGMQLTQKEQLLSNRMIIQQGIAGHRTRHQRPRYLRRPESLKQWRLKCCKRMSRVVSRKQHRQISSRQSATNSQGKIPSCAQLIDSLVADQPVRNCLYLWHGAAMLYLNACVSCIQYVLIGYRTMDRSGRPFDKPTPFTGN